MNTLGRIAVWSFLFIVSATLAMAKEWRGIVPLESTRADVERILGVPKKTSPRAAYYSLPGEIAVIHFQNTECDQFGLGWHVPLGTVVSIGVIPKGTHRKEEYLNATNLKVEDVNAGLIYYLDEAAGLTIETYKNLVTLVDYDPGAGDEKMRCPRIQECCVDFFPKFDEYQILSFEDEKARLDNFLIQMNDRLARGVLEVVGPSRQVRDRRMKLAARAKTYLVKERRLEPERLLLVDGGYGKILLTRLSLYSIGGLASRIYVFPERDPVNTAPNKRLQRTGISMSLIDNSPLAQLPPGR